MKHTIRITLILPKDKLSPREQSAMPPHFRHGRKRLRVTVEADNELEAIEIAKKPAETTAFDKSTRMFSLLRSIGFSAKNGLYLWDGCDYMRRGVTVQQI
jgi:hypothetical protein